MLSQSPAKMLKIFAPIDTAQIEKHLVNAVLLNPRRQLFECNHHALAQIVVKRIVRTEHKDLLRVILHFNLKPGHTLFDAQRFFSGTARNNASIIVIEYHHGFTAKIGTEEHLTARIE